MQFLLGFLMVMFVATTAIADTVRRTVSVNKASPVASHSIYNPDCTAGNIPDFKIREAPKHGKVSFQVISVKLDERTGRCAGKDVKASLVVYQPNRGFRGEDNFKVGFVMNMYTSGAADIRNVVKKFVIEVK